MDSGCGGVLAIKSSDFVEFLHGTVRDFLCHRKTSEHLKKKTSPDFMTILSTWRAYAALTKIRPRAVCSKFHVRNNTARPLNTRTMSWTKTWIPHSII